MVWIYLKWLNQADLTDLIENDNYFNVSDYNQKVFYSGQLDGKQYFIPTGYKIPVFLTTQTLIDEKYVDIKKFDKFSSTMNEFNNILQKNKSTYGLEKPMLGGTPLIFEHIFMNFIDINYANSTVDINKELIKDELGKQKDIYKNQDHSGYFSVGFENSKNLLAKSSILALNTQSTFYDLLDNCRYISTTEEPVIEPMLNVHNQITALATNIPLVNEACSDKQNAYNFLKILISPDIQGYTDGEALDILRHESIPISNVGRDIILKKMKTSETVNSYELTGLNDGFVDNYKNIIDNIENVAYSTPIHSIFYETVQLYFEDKMDIDTCLQSLQDKLEIYISE